MMVEFLLVLLVVVGMALTSNLEETEQPICFEKKVKHNISRGTETDSESTRMKTDMDLVLSIRW